MLINSAELDFRKNSLAIFDELGSYKLLDNLKDPAHAEGGSKSDGTLSVYLFNNGNSKIHGFHFSTSSHCVTEWNGSMTFRTWF